MRISIMHIQDRLRQNLRANIIISFLNNEDKTKRSILNLS